MMRLCDDGWQAPHYNILDTAMMTTRVSKKIYCLVHLHRTSSTVDPSYQVKKKKNNNNKKSKLIY
jgi:hypothetical protein